MTRTMYDSTDQGIIPAGAQMVAGYVNGHWPSFEGLKAGHPQAEAVSIAVTTAADADVLDVEAGDATPGDTGPWVDRQKRRGLWRPSIYCPRASYGAVRQGTGRFVLGVDYDMWVADWTGQPHGLGLGEAAVQYADPGMIPGRPNYDLSLVLDDGWPHRTQAAGPGPSPAPAPPPAPLPPPVAAPGFPLPPGHWYGVASPDDRNHSGTVNAADRPGIAAFQQQLRNRGWNIAVDGIFGPATRATVTAFQREKGLVADGLVGPITWATIWTAPVT